MRETLLYLGQGSAKDFVGIKVRIDGRSGTVVAGSSMFITIEWDEPEQSEDWLIYVVAVVLIYILFSFIALTH